MPLVEQYIHNGTAWVYSGFEKLSDSFYSPTLSASLTLAQIYENVGFESDDEADNNTEAPTDTSES